MILLDTNVISEPWKQLPDPRALTWIDTQAADSLFLSVITVAELRSGIAVMPAGKRRLRLHEMLESWTLPRFASRILQFDLAASEAYAKLMARAKAAGQAIQIADGLIAATAAAHGLIVATRDESPFKAAGLTVINPWTHTH